MSGPTSIGGILPPPTASCFQRTVESQWTTMALAACMVALLIISILVLSGVFDFMGKANAALFGYSAWIAVGLVSIAVLVKFCLAQRYKKENPPHNPPIDVAAMQARAKQFASELPSPEDRKQFQILLLAVIGMPEFRENPVEYVQEWIKERDNPLGKGPERDALRFFSNELKIWTKN